MTDEHAGGPQPVRQVEAGPLEGGREPAVERDDVVEEGVEIHGPPTGGYSPGVVVWRAR